MQGREKNAHLPNISSLLNVFNFTKKKLWLSWEILVGAAVCIFYDDERMPQPLKTITSR